MIEQAIYFALGCVVTALAALGFAPFFWRRALRLTRARLQLQVPLSMQEILAERDQLRAEYAVERLKAEQIMERVRTGKTRDMAVIGRHRVAATEMTDEIASLRRLEQSQESEIRRLLDDLAASEAEGGAVKVALYDAHALLERWRAHVDRDAASRTAMRTELDDKRILVASLETRATGLETRLADAQHAGESREHGLRGRLETAMAHAARHETSGLSLRRDLDEARLRIRALEQEVEAASVDAREREKYADLQQSLQNGKTRGLDRANAETIEGLRADNAAILDGDGALRASIHALGLAVARMSWTERPEAAEPPERERQRLGAAP